MKIALCSLSDREDIRGLSWPLMESYCKRHGYDFVTQTELIFTDRHPSWSKIPFLRRLIQTYDIVIWFDDDILLTQPDTHIESILGPFLDSDQLIAASANNDAPFNFGLIVCKSTAEPCLEKISDAVTDENRYGLYWEETAGGTLYRTDPTFKEQVYIFPQGILQGYHGACSHQDYKWRPKTFSLHVSGVTPKDYRIKLMKEAIEILNLKTRFCLHESSACDEL